MARMSNTQYDEAKKYIIDNYQYGTMTKESYIRFLKDVIYRYEDGRDCAEMLDKYQTKWTVLGKEL